MTYISIKSNNGFEGHAIEQLGKAPSHYLVKLVNENCWFNNILAKRDT